jgi:hypothetical protein
LKVFACILFCVQGAAATSESQEEKSLEATISPYLDDQDFKETFEHIYLDLGNGQVISLGRWLRERSGRVDERTSNDALIGEEYRNLPGLPPIVFDKDRIQDGAYGDVLGAKHKGRSFVNIAKSFEHDLTLGKPGFSLSRGIYGPQSVNPLTPADEQLGEITFGGARSPIVEEIKARFK